MFEKLLVPLDGSPLAERILASLEPLLLRPGTQVQIVRVVPGTREKHDEKEHADALRYLRTLEVRLSSQGVNVGGHLLVGPDPADEIVQFAAREGASVIYLATHGRTGLVRAALGSVAEKVLRTADRPVVLVSPWAPAAPIQFKKVLVPLDGSVRSDEALAVASEISKHYGSEIVLLHVEEFGALDPVVAVASEHEFATRLFERATRALDGARVRTITKSGVLVAPYVLDAIREEMPDVVLMTTHGRTGLARVAFGSVTEAVVRRSPVPVLVKRSVPALAPKAAALMGAP
ncbi:MAG TPA: universal stress protein [Planctomycetota bacterium]|nr:universal stress protein [Planctomycetota bacterium]